MKNILYLGLIAFVFVSCKKENNSTSTPPKKGAEEILEIAFIKEGELTISNAESPIKKLDIEIADSPLERQEGLMHRSSMEEDKGMLFVFQEPKIQTFWMKNTRIPLDIIFIDENKKVINIAENVQPFVERGVEPSDSPAKYVLEVGGGLSDKWGIIEGETTIDWIENN